MRKVLSCFSMVLMSVALTTAGMTQEPGATAQTATGPQRMQERITHEVRHELVMLPS